MNALLVSNMYPSSKNPGYGVFVKNFERSLTSYGARFDLSVIEGRELGTLNKTIKYIIFFTKTWRLILTKKYNVIYVHYAAHSLLPLVPLLPLILMKGSRIVCNFHGEDLLPSTRMERIISNLVDPVIRKSDLIVVPSQFFLNLCKNKYPCNKIIVSPSGGVNRSIFKPAANKANNKSVLHLGFASRIENGKGLDVLLRATRYALDQYTLRPIKITIIGEGSQSEKLKALACDLNLDNHVVFAGALPQSELPIFYQSIDAFIFPTTLPESLGLVGIESLSCGTPAICSNIGGMREYILDSFNGYLFTPGDHKDLASKILLFDRLSEIELEKLRKNAAISTIPYDSVRVSQELYKTLTDL